MPDGIDTLAIFKRITGKKPVGGVKPVAPSVVTPTKPISPEGRTFTGKDEYGIPYNFRVTPDYQVFKEGKKVGKINDVTGEFTPTEPSFWDKASAFIKLIPVQLWKSLPINPYYWKDAQEKSESDRRDILLDWAKKQGVEDPESYVKELMEAKAGEVSWRAYEPTAGEVRIPEIPVKPISGREITTPGERFIGEWVGPTMLLAAPALKGVTAIAGWKAAGALPTAAKVAVRIPLAPVAGYEWVVGKTLYYVFGKPIGAAFNKLSDIVAKGKWNASPISKAFTGPEATDAYKIWRLHQTNPEQAEMLLMRTLRTNIKFADQFQQFLLRLKPETFTGGATEREAVIRLPLLLGIGEASVGATSATTTALARIADTIIKQGISATRVTPAFIASQIPQGVTLEKTPSLILQLKDLGYTEATISAMKPKEAWANLFKAPVAPSVTPKVTKPEAGMPEAVDKRIADINKLLATKGRLPAGQGTRADLSIELARLEAQREVAGMTNLGQLDTAIAEIQEELGLRSMPFHGRETNAFPQYITKQLDEQLKVYNEARIDALRSDAEDLLAQVKLAEAEAPTIQKIKAIQQRGRIDPASVSPEEARVAHTMLGAVGDIPPSVPPPGGHNPIFSSKQPEDILRQIADKATIGERPNQTLLRLHEGAISTEQSRTKAIVLEGNKKLKKAGIGIATRGQLVVMPNHIAKMDELYNALHNPSKVASGEIKIPKGLEGIYDELRGLTDWEQSSRLDFDPEMATVEDYFYRGWKPPQGATPNINQGRPLVRTPSFKLPRVNATYLEMRELGFEPLSWNPYQQWQISRMQGVKYREQMELVTYLKNMGDQWARPIDGGVVPEGWRIPQVGPAFEGKPFATLDPMNNQPTVMFSRRWMVPDSVANTLESIYGKRPDLGKIVFAGKSIDPLTIIDALTFGTKRAKLFGSFFQQQDFLERSGFISWGHAFDAALAGHPVEAIVAGLRYPQIAINILKSNFHPATRLSLLKQLDSTEPLIKGRPDVHFRGIREAGLSTADVTIFPADMDKVIQSIAKETGIAGIVRGFGRLIGDIESAMRRGLFDGTYPASVVNAIKYHIAPMMARHFPSATDAQLNGMIATETNKMFSLIPASQSVIQNRVLRESLRRVMFSMNENEGLLRQAAGAIKGPQAWFWRRYYIGAFLFLAIVANLIHFASTGKPLPKERYVPISKDAYGPLPFGYNTQFMAPTLPIKGRGGVELTLDLVGQADTAFRVLNPTFFITSRESVPVRILINQISGTDFYGAPITDVGPGGIISRISQALYDGFAPIGIGGLLPEIGRRAAEELGSELFAQTIPEYEDRLGLLGLGIQTTGLNLRAEMTMALLDRVARESGFLKADGTPVRKWDDLEQHQKKDLSKNEMLETELGLRSKAAVERQQQRALGFATLDDLDKERIVRGEALVTEFLTETRGLEGTDYRQRANQFRNEVTLLKREISSRKGQVDIDFKLFEDTGKLPEDPNKRALVEYYNTFELARKPSKEIDWDKQEAIETALRKLWTSAKNAYVDRNIGLTEWGFLMTEYIKDMEALKEYWAIPKGTYQATRREAYRLAHSRIDAILVRWYGYKPISGRTITPRPTPKRPGELDTLDIFRRITGK